MDSDNNILIFPNQLFVDHELIDKDSTVYLIEHPVYFTKYNFHKMRLVFHRATMRYYQSYLKKKYGCRVVYVEFKDKLSQILAKLKNKSIHSYDPVDHHVETDIRSICKKHNIELIFYDNPLFLNKMTDFCDYLLSLSGKKTRDVSESESEKETDYDLELREAEKLAKDIESFTHANFYRWMRKHHDILMVSEKPKGGKWSYDVQNRLPFPKNFSPNYKPHTVNNKFIAEAKNYVNKHFKENPGEIDIYLPIDHAGAKRHFQKFLKERFKCFGPYQDAVDFEIPFGCHSVISALLNIGLLTPEYVIQEAEKQGTKYRVPIQSIEAFIRQLFWREYCFFWYKFKRVELEKSNHFGHKRKLNKDLWYYCKGSSGIPVIDDLIQKSWDLSYLHHIERLMYIGNYFLLTKVHPKEVHDWFISMVSLDAYHWVMYPNVYGMSQHSIGPLMMTRPYFSSSSYIMRMSNYNRRDGELIILGQEEYNWADLWDALYYNFIADHSTEFSKNYAIATQVKHWKNKSVSEQKKIRSLAKKYLDKY